MVFSCGSTVVTPLATWQFSETNELFNIEWHNHEKNDSICLPVRLQIGKTICFISLNDTELPFHMYVQWTKTYVASYTIKKLESTVCVCVCARTHACTRVCRIQIKTNSKTMPLKVTCELQWKCVTFSTVFWDTLWMHSISLDQLNSCY